MSAEDMRRHHGSRETLHRLFARCAISNAPATKCTCLHSQALRNDMKNYFASLEPQTARDRLPRAICEGALTKLCMGNTSIGFALISTRDAHVVSHRAQTCMDSRRLAAMTSSILAICESLSNEFDGGSCLSVSLTMSEYTCVIARIPAEQHSIALAIGVRGEVLLARARRLTLDTADRIAASLDALTVEQHLAPSTPGT